MAVLGMTLKDTLTPVTKKNFKKWHSEGSLLLLNAGHGNLDIILSRLNNITIEYRAQGKQLITAMIDGKNITAHMFSNGCDEFILLIDDMQGSDYSKGYFKREHKQHITVYVVND